MIKRKLYNQNSKLLLFFFAFLLTSVCAKSQELASAKINRLETEAGIKIHAEIPENQRISENQAALFLEGYFNLDKNSYFREIRRISFENELHIRFQHFMDEHEVVGSEMIAHFKNGLMRSFNGSFYELKSSSPVLSSNQAIDLALNHINASIYNWELEEEERMYKLWKEDSSASYFPKPELVYAPKAFDFSTEPEICYRMEIYAHEPLLRKDVYVNALSGEIWAEEDLLHIADVTASANTKYRGTQTIITDSTAPNTYRLREAGRGGGIETYNMLTGTSYAAAVDFYDSDNYWNNYNASFDEIATDAHFGAEMTYDYFLDRHNRNSFDDNGAKIRSYVHYRSAYNNAFWNGSVMTYGDGNGTTFTPLTSIDVCGHEVSHAVTTNSANLIYSYESGALNESFSDIFGNTIERYADSSQFNWRVGEDITPSGNGIRNMANPNTHGDPDTYQGTFWHTAATDNGGVHTNSGVQNFWYYLLCEGGSGTNDNGDAFTVDSLGIAKAEAIAYRNLTVYLGRNSDYEDARYYGIQSAADLFGSCSDEVVTTTNAWYAVGVGPEYDSSEVIADFTADSFYCYANELVQFVNLSSNAKAYEWDFGNGDTSTNINPTTTYNQQGAYNVELIAEGCFNSVYDTTLKISFIVIDSTQDICNAYLMPPGSWDTVYACNGFVYDHSGDDDYTNLLRDTLTVVYAPADSAHITFIEFAYETDWDSIYLYDGYNTSATLIGGYTGTNLPNGGNPILLTSGAFTITHFSDPFVTDLGFKAEFTVFRDSLALIRTPDTTVCYKQAIELSARGSGGNPADQQYYWNGIKGDSTFNLLALNDTVIYVAFGDACLEEFIYDSIVITVRDSLRLMPIADTTLCYLEDISLEAMATGGDTANYVFTWLPANVNTNPWNTEFADNQTILLSIQDGCTQQSDTTSFNITVRDSISFSQSTDTTICEGGETTQRLSINGGTGTFWVTESLTGNSSSNSGIWSTTHSNLLPGTHNLWAAISDQCTDTRDTAFWTITVRDSLDISAINDTTICYGSSLTISAIASGGLPSAYLYDWGSGNSASSSLTVNPLTSTTYYIELSDGCSDYQPIDSVIVSVLDSLQVSISGPTTACYNEEIQLDAAVSGGDATAYSYNWNSGPAATSSFLISSSIAHTVTLEVSDGCTPQNGYADIDIDVLPSLVLNMPNDTAICNGGTAILSPTAIGGKSADYLMSWDNGLGTGFSKMPSPTTSTTYTVTLSDNCSEDVIASVDVTVNPLPIMAFSIDPNPYCTGLNVNFTNESVFGSGSQFEWSFGDGGTDIAENPFHAYTAAGLYSIKLKLINEFNCSDSLTKVDELEIVAHPVANFSFSPLVANFFKPDFTFNNSSLNANIYSWSFGDGGGTADENPYYVYSDTGTYMVTLRASNDIGCEDVISKTALVEDVFVLHIPNAFSPNGDQVNDQFNIYVRGLASYEMIVFNRWGEILWKSSESEKSWNGTFKGEVVDPGMYFYLLNGIDFEGKAVDRKGSIVLMN